MQVIRQNFCAFLIFPWLWWWLLLLLHWCICGGVLASSLVIACPNNETFCQHGGKCVWSVAAQSTQCNCPAPWTGPRCNHKLANASFCNNLCQNEAPCIYGNPSRPFQCLCPSGHLGLLCEYADPCYRTNPCNNGSCRTNAVAELFCDCPPGWKGVHCESMDDPCAVEGIHDDLPVCGKHGKCLPQWNPRGFRCSCEPGFNGTRCEMNIDECATRPCFNGGICLEKRGYYLCNCLVGFQGKHCEEKASIVVEVSLNESTINMIVGEGLSSWMASYIAVPIVVLVLVVMLVVMMMIFRGSWSARPGKGSQTLSVQPDKMVRVSKTWFPKFQRLTGGAGRRGETQLLKYHSEDANMVGSFTEERKTSNCTSSTYHSITSIPTDTDLSTASFTVQEILRFLDFLKSDPMELDHHHQEHSILQLNSMLQMFLSKHSIVTPINSEGETLLHYAARINSHPTVICYLLRMGSDHQALDYHGHTPLITAAGCNAVESLHCLLEAERHELNNNGIQHQNVESMGGQETVATLKRMKLVKLPMEDPKQNHVGLALIEAIRHGGRETICSLLHLDYAAGPSNLESRLQPVKDAHGRTALHWCALVSDVETLRVLLSLKVFAKIIDNPDDQQRTALMYAVTEGCRECVLELLQRKADPTLTDELGFTCHDLALQVHDHELYHILCTYCDSLALSSRMFV